MRNILTILFVFNILSAQPYDRITYYNNEYSANQGNKTIVKNVAQLFTAVANPPAGKIIEIKEGVYTIPLVQDDGEYNYGLNKRLLFQEDMTLTGRTYATRPTITFEVDTTQNTYLMFEVKSCNVNFKNLYLDGKNYDPRDYGHSGTAIIGISVGGLQGERKWYNSQATIDSCELANWQAIAVGFVADSDGEVKNSYIHGNDGYGNGYGVKLDGGSKVVVHHCVMDSNRHHISSSGHPENVYIAYENDVHYSTWSIKAFDTHANYMRAGSDPTVSEWDLRASDSIIIRDNRFYENNCEVFESPGYPVSGYWIYDNTFIHHWIYDKAGSDTWNGKDYGFTTPFLSTDWNSQQDSVYETHGGWFIGDNIYGDYDGDGITDSTTWQIGMVSFDVQYNGNWNRLAGFGRSHSTCWDGELYPIDSLGFGDFNGDGVTDIVTNYLPYETRLNWGSHGTSDSLYVSWGAWQYFSTLNSVMTGKSMSKLDFADVDGDGFTDIIYNETEYLSAGRGTWIDLPKAFSSYSLYTKRDFNGDGVDDNYRISSD